MTNKKFADPGDQVIIHHIRALHTLIHHWPPDHIQHVEQAWLDIRTQLQHPWYHVKGPMAATRNGVGRRTPSTNGTGMKRPS